MKRKTLVSAALSILLLVNVTAQDFTEARRYFDTLEKEIRTGDTLLMSYPALNIFMARKVNTYLAGSSDLSLNKNWFVLDPSDGTLFLGWNIAKDPSEGEARTRWILTPGLKADLSDAFSTIYSGAAKKLSSNMGLSIKATILGRGKVFYDKKNVQVQKAFITFLGPAEQQKPSFTQKDLALYNRERLRNEMNAMMSSDLADFEKINLNVGTDAFIKKEKEDFFKNKNSYYKRQYITREADYFDDPSTYKAFWNQWVSFALYIPFTCQDFDVADDFTSPVSQKSLYNFEGSILWSNIYEDKRVRLFGLLGTGVKYLNNISTSLMDSYTLGDYLDMGGTDTLHLAELETSKVFIGDYDEFLTPFMRVQLVSLFLFGKQAGLSLLAEKSFGDYDPLNLRVGIPFYLEGNGDTKVTFELQLRWNDFDNSLFPDKSRAGKFALGISVGVPLSGKLY